MTHSAPYKILGDVYFVVQGICVEIWLRLMTLLIKKKYFKDLTKWGEQDTFVIMGRTRYICYHEENKIHLLSWGEQDTFIIMGRTRYI
jgi:hypothetical protein